MQNNSYERYAKIRDLRGLTDYQVTKRAGIKGTATISNWKNGKYTPKDDKMQEIANVLEVDLDYLKGKNPYTVCPVCGFSYDILNKEINNEHEIIHEKYFAVKEKYPFFKQYYEATVDRNESVCEFRNYSNDIDQKLDALDRYLQSSFSLEIIKNDYDIRNLDYNQFCKIEVSNIHEDDCISKELVDAIVEKYGVDKSFMSGNEHLLARVSKNDQLMRILRYVEKINPEILDNIEIQLKALAEQGEKE